MIGTVNVSNLLYQGITILFLLRFALYDIRHHKVRNTALLAFLPWCILSIPLSIKDCNDITGTVCNSLLGFITGGLFLLSVSLVTQGGIGGGDIKIVALLGLLQGPFNILLTIIIASIAAVTYHGFKAMVTKKKMIQVAFVPYIFFGFLITSYIERMKLCLTLS